MRSIYLMGCEDDFVPTPAIMAILNVAIGEGFKFDDDATQLNEVLRDKIIAYLQNESDDRLPFRSGVGFTTASERSARVPLGPDYLNAAIAFLSDPNSATFQADRDAYFRLRAHVDRISKLM